MNVSSNINASIKIIGESSVQEFTTDFLYIQSSCHAFHMRFTDVYLYSISLSETHFLEKHALTGALRSLKFRLTLSDCDGVTRKERKRKCKSLYNFYPMFQ